MSNTYPVLPKERERMRGRFFFLLVIHKVKYIEVIYLIIEVLCLLCCQAFILRELGALHQEQFCTVEFKL